MVAIMNSPYVGFVVIWMRHCYGKAVVDFMSIRHGGHASKSDDTEVADMKDSEILSLVIGIIGVVLSAIIVGSTIG